MYHMVVKANYGSWGRCCIQHSLHPVQPMTIWLVWLLATAVHFVGMLTPTTAPTTDISLQKRNVNHHTAKTGCLFVSPKSKHHKSRSRQDAAWVLQTSILQ